MVSLKKIYKTRVQFIIGRRFEELLPETLYALAGQGFWIEDRGTYSLFKCYPVDVEKFIQSLYSWGIKVKELYLIKEKLEDYIELTRKYFSPIHIEDLTILPPWSKKKDHEPSITIEPGMAFGTGRHESTKVMIKLMKHVPMKNKRVLDVGCGSGILSLYSSLLGAKAIIGIDCDMDAILSARKNAKLNNAEKIKYRYVDLKDMTGRYDIVLANLDKDTFFHYANHLKSLVKRKGYLIVSGILTRDEKKILYLFAPSLPIRIRRENSWTGFIFQIDNQSCFG